VGVKGQDVLLLLWPGAPGRQSRSTVAPRRRTPSRRGISGRPSTRCSRA